MVAYLDSSLVLRYILKGEVAIQHALMCETVVSSELDDRTCVAAIGRFDKMLAGISLVSLSSAVKKRAMEAFPVVINTLDALHLATALAFAEKRPDEKVLVFSHDEGMNRCAAVLGFGIMSGI